MEVLINTLVAHDVDQSRWKSALLIGCGQVSDAAWVRKNLLSFPWEEAIEMFLRRCRNPLYYQHYPLRGTVDM